MGSPTGSAIPARGADGHAAGTFLGVQVGITSGAAAVHDGRVVWAASEERFTRVKNETVFPERSIAGALEHLDRAGLPRPGLVVLPSENLDFEHYALRRECTFSVADYLREQHELYRPRLYEGRRVGYADVFPERFDGAAIDAGDLAALRAAEDPRRAFREWRIERARAASGLPEVACVNHERAHAAYALHASPLPKSETLVVTVDGFGDEGNASIWTWEDGRLRCHRVYREFNVGRVYRYMTLLLGMKPSEHEYKVMGLAPYAHDPWAERAHAVFARGWYVDPADGEVRCHERPDDCYFWFRDRLEGQRFDAIAAGLQRWSEEMLCDLVRHWAPRLEKRRLVLAGGVSLNIKANMLLGELDCLDEIWVPPSGGDESLCMGAVFALLDAQGQGERIQPLEHAWLGNEHSQADIDAAVGRFLASGAPFRARLGVPTRDLARLLADGRILARFAGRMEFGARSLGNRAILADPRQPDVVRRINSSVKHRDFWMPFTPSILAERASDYLRNPKGHRFPYMTVACGTTELGREDLAGALHPADRSARPQLVERESNPDYWQLLSEFERLTGVGGLLNTSLNLSGLPICESPDDVFEVLRGSEIDAAVLGTTLLVRERTG